MLRDGSQKDAQTARNDNQYGQQQEHTDIVGDLPVDAALALHLPDFIQRNLDIAGQLDNGIKQQQKTETDEEAALGMFQIRADKIKNQVGKTLIHTQVALDFILNNRAVTETAPYGEDNGQNGYYRQNGRKGKSRSIAVDVPAEITLYRKHHFFHHPEHITSCRRKLTFVDIPYLLSEKEFYLTITELHRFLIK